MKSVIETSVYLILMTIICVISLDFVNMNRSISKVNEVENYIEDYVAAYGMRDGDNSLDEATFNSVKNYAAKNGMNVSFVYETETTSYVYYKMALEYEIKSNVFNVNKNYVYNGLVRVETVMGSLQL